MNLPRAGTHPCMALSYLHTLPSVPRPTAPSVTHHSVNIQAAVNTALTANAPAGANALSARRLIELARGTSRRSARQRLRASFASGGAEEGEWLLSAKSQTSLLQLRVYGLGAASEHGEKRCSDGSTPSLGKGNGGGSGRADLWHEQEVYLTLLPIRVLVLVGELQRLQLWLESGLESFQDAAAAAAEEAMASAGQAAIDAGQAVLEKPPPMKLYIRLLGPLVVLPSPSCKYDSQRKAAVVLRAGDLLLHSSLVWREWEGGRDGGEGMARLKLSLSNTQLLIAWRGSEIDEQWILHSAHQPRWLLPGLHLSLLVDQARLPVASRSHRCMADQARPGPHSFMYLMTFLVY